MWKNKLAQAFPRALWVYHTNTGACNGCDIEVIDVLTPYYDAERFGIKLVASPRHADVLLCCGPVTRQVVPALRRLYDAVPDPKIVLAIGSCATGGGIWFDTYNVVGGVDAILPVNFCIPGCPPKPEAILHGVAVALGILQKDITPPYLMQLPDRPESVAGSIEDIPEVLPRCP